MGASVAVGFKKTRKPSAEDPEAEAPGADGRKLPDRGMLRVLGFNRTPVPLSHEGSWLEVTVLEAKDLPAADDNGTVHWLPFFRIGFHVQKKLRRTQSVECVMHCRLVRPLH